MRNCVDVDIEIVTIDEYGDFGADGNSICCVEYESDCGEYWGVPCSQTELDIEPAREELKEMAKMAEEDGYFVVATYIDGELEDYASPDEIRGFMDRPDLTDDEIEEMINEARGV